MLLFYLTLSIGVSFLCSLFEAAILSVSPAYVASLEITGGRSGRLLAKLKHDIDDSLSAILTLNTIAHTIGAAGVGAEVLRLYGSRYVALGSIILTILVLVLSEIIPKTLGARYSRFFSPITAYGVQAFIYLTYPFVYSFKVLARLLGSTEQLAAVTREEVAYTAELGLREGSLTKDESQIIKNLLRLRSILVKDVMTPRVVVFALKESLSLGQVAAEFQPIGYSRIPVYRDTVDEIVGYVLRYDILKAIGEGNLQIKLSEISKPLRPVPDLLSLAKVFDDFIKSREQIFSVFDERGSFEGVITLEDVIETLLGFEIVDEFDSVADLRAYAKAQWEKRRSAS